MTVCTKVNSVSLDEGVCRVITDGIEIRVSFLLDGVVRIRAGFDKDFREESYALATTAWADRMDSVIGDKRKRVELDPCSIVEDNDKKCVIDSGTLSVEVEKDPFRICIYSGKGDSRHLVHADVVDIGYQEDSNHRRIHSAEIEPTDCFFGFGEKSGEWNKAQTIMTMSPKDSMGYDAKHTDSLYKHIPFYIRLNKATHEAVGYYYNNTAECDFDMGRDKSNYWHMHSRYRVDSGDIDLFVIPGGSTGSISSIVDSYTKLTGRSCMLPEYALGYLGSSMYYAELDKDCDDAIVSFIDTAKKEGIPIDGFQLSSGYCTVQVGKLNKRCVFTWNKTRFKDPKDFFKQMSDRGIEVSPNVKPGLLLVHPMLEEFKRDNMLVLDSKEDKPAIGTWWGGKGMFVDFTRASTREHWKKLLKQHVIDYGTSSIWNDNCEYDSLVDKDGRCYYEDGSGCTIGKIKAVMSNLMCQLAVEAIEEAHPNTRPFVVCRSGHAGIQRYAQTWAGDNLTCWDTLKYNIATILGMGLSGVANQGCDIGGFFGPAPEPELFVRWVQNGIFQPRFSIHSVNTDDTITEPWMYHEYKGIIRDAIKFRYRMIPYMYSLMYRAHTTGMPIMEPLCLEFQNDSKCYEDGVDFTLGSGLLVANVVEKQVLSRKVYLPEGATFYDYYNRMPYEGGTTVEVPVTIASIPMFLYEGAIIPMAGNQIYNVRKEPITDLTILCVPNDRGDKRAQFTLYEDDGVSLDYEKGVYLATDIVMTSGKHTTLEFTHKGSYATKVERMAIDMVKRSNSPFWVTIDGRKIEHFLYRPAYEAASEGWYYSMSLRSVQIKYANPKKDYKIVVSFDGFDMIGM